MSVHMLDHLNKKNSLFFYLVFDIGCCRIRGGRLQLTLLILSFNVRKLAPKVLLKRHMPIELALTTGKVTSKTCLKHPREVDMRSLGKLDVESNLLVFPSPKAGFILSSLIIDIGARSFWSRIYDLTMIVPFGCSLFSHRFPTQSVSSVLI